MVAKGWKVVSMREQAYNEVQARYVAKAPKFTSFTAWFSNYVIEAIEGDKELEKHMPYLELAREPYDNTIEIADRLHDAVYPVQIKERRLFCIKDEREDCIHVGACFAIRKTAKVLNEHGFKPPKVK